MARFVSCLVVSLAVISPCPTQAQQTLSSQAAAPVCRVYALHELGNDPNLAKWIVATIPQMIQPASWKSNGNECALRYFEPTKTLVVRHTPDAHRQIDEFLRSMKAKLQASQRSPAVIQQTAASVMLPARPATPKHLFHFIIRSESEDGIKLDISKYVPAIPLMPVNQYSSDPMVRMEQLMIDSENLRAMHDEWRRFWMNDQPSQLTPYRIHGTPGPAIE